MRYWFDNSMSRGIGSLIAWLAIVSLLLIVGATAAFALIHKTSLSTDLNTLWDTFIKTFGLGVPSATGTAPPPTTTADIAVWFVLALGGIFVVSALVGLLTSGLHRQMEQLRKGRSVVAESRHTVILGWSDQVYTVVSELIEANRSRRRASVVILADEDKIEMEDRLRHRIRDYATTRIVCRTGNPLDLSDLELVNLAGARAIIVIAPQTDRAEDADSYVLKTLLAIGRGPFFRGKPHLVIAAVRDGRNRPVAQLADNQAVVIDADDISARLVVQTARQSGLSVVYTDLFDFGGDEFYLVREPKLTGKPFGQALFSYRTSCPVGLLHANGATSLNPPANHRIAPDDRIVILAEDDSTIKFDDRPMPVDESAIVHSVRGPQAPEHTLILGWNARATKIIEQLDIYVTAGSTVDIVTERHDADPAMARLSPGLRKLTSRVKDGDTRDRNALESLDVGAYQNIIVLSDDQLDPLTADARVLVTLLHLRDMLSKRGKQVSIVSEMRDERDRALASLTRADDFVVSEQLVSLLMTQIAESRHLESVFVDLLNPDGSEIYIRPASYYIRPVANLTFATVVEAARRRGEVAMGYRIAEPGEGQHGIVLNPDKSKPMPVIDRVIVLAEG
jgi:voltage-gated potassium channel Kch